MLQFYFFLTDLPSARNTKKKVGAKSALLPGWEQNKNYNKKGDHEQDEDGADDNDIVKYGGLVHEGETDEVEERVAKREVKKIKDENVELLSPSLIFTTLTFRALDDQDHR